MFWADTLGSKYIYERLKKWEITYGGFFKPSRYLEERAMNGTSLVLYFLLRYPCILVHCYNLQGTYLILCMQSLMAQGSTPTPISRM